MKLAANATCSRKNITHSLGVKEQFYLCYRFSSKIGLIDNQKLSSILFADDISFFNYFSTFKSSLPANFMSKCLEVSWVEYKGIIYKPGLCIVVTLSSNTNERTARGKLKVQRREVLNEHSANSETNGVIYSNVFII